MKREEHVHDSGHRAIEQEENTGVCGVCRGQGWEGREWSKDLQASIWQLHWIPKTFRSHSSKANGNPLQCSCLENPRDRGAWWAAVSGVAQDKENFTLMNFQEHILSI